MKIAYIICTFPPYRGGMGNSAFNIAKVSADAGNDVTIFTPDYGCKLTEEESKKESSLKFKIVRLKSFLKYGNAAILPQIFFKLKDFDIVHLHYPFYGTAEIVLLRKIFDKKMRLIIHYHMDGVGGGLKGLIFNLTKRSVLPKLVKLSEAVTCGSIDYIRASDMSDLYLKYKDKFHETFFGVDLQRFSTNKEMSEIGREGKYILFVGGLDKAHYFKGLENLIKAFKKISSAVDNCFLTIIGSGDLEKYYKDLADKSGVSEKIKFFGKVPNEGLPSYYNNSDVFVLPSINKGEAFGLVLLEAMASGVPVVATSLSGVRTVFTDGEQGFYARPDDVDDLAEKIILILQNKELAEKMGKAGRKLVEEKYSWEEVGKRIMAVYNKIIP